MQYLSPRAQRAGARTSRAAPHLAVEGLVLVAEAAQVEQRLHNRLLRGRLGLLQRELVPVDAARVLLALRRLRARAGVGAINTRGKRAHLMVHLSVQKRAN